LICTQGRLFSHIGDSCCYLVCVSVSYPFDTTCSLSVEARPLLFRQQHSLSLLRRSLARSVCSDAVTPAFPKKTKCIPICMPRSSFMHIVTYKCIQKTVSRKKKKDYQRLRLILETKTQHHRQSTGGCIRLAPATSSQDFIVASTF
jgi:hypothetical protein